MASTTPVTTPAGADPFAGAPGTGTTTPAASPPAASPPGATAALTGGIPQFTGKSGSSTFGGMPTNLFHDTLTVPGFHAPGLSPEDQTGQSTIPAYTDGDQWAPASDPNPDNVRQLQSQLIQAGLLSTSSVHLGIWDATSATAYAKVLAQANTQGVNAQTALDGYIASEQASLPSAQMNPDDLKALGNVAGQAVYGRNLNADEMARFQTAFAATAATEPGLSSAGAQQLGSDILTKNDPKAAASASLHSVSQRALQVLSNPAVNLPSPQ